MTLSDDAKVVSGTLAASFGFLICSLFLLFGDGLGATAWAASILPGTMFLVSWWALSDDAVLQSEDPQEAPR